MPPLAVLEAHESEASLGIWSVPECIINPLLPPRPPLNSRNSEGDFIQLKDGSILFAYSHFTGALHYDHEPAFVAGRVSYDLGQTWSGEDHTVLKNEGGMNIMSVSLLRTLDGKLAIFYSRKNSVDDCRIHMRISEDEGKSWGPARLCIPEAGYYPINNDRVIRLQSGRLVIPLSRHDSCLDPEGHPAVSDLAVASSVYSDDDGATWKHSDNVLQLSGPTKSGLQEPGIVELKSGRLMMWMRTDQGCQYRSYSEDGGESWSQPEPSNIISPLSPASIKRIPATGDLLLAWNDHRDIDDYRRGKRTPLCLAVSDDEGESWQNVKILEDKNVDGYYCYTAIEFFEDRILLAYCAGDQGDNHGGLDQTNIARLNLDWLYAK